METNDIHNEMNNNMDENKEENKNEHMDDNAVSELMKEPKANLSEPSIKNKLVMLGVVVVLVIAGLATALIKFYKVPVVVEGCKPGDLFSETSGQPCNGDVLKTCKPGELFNRSNGEACIGVEDKNAIPSTEYQDTLKSYEGKSVLFDATCTPAPKTLSLSVGVKVLLANNSKKTMELIVQGVKGNLLPYSVMTSSFLSAGNFPVTCNGRAGATNIIVK